MAPMRLSSAVENQSRWARLASVFAAREPQQAKHCSRCHCQVQMIRLVTFDALFTLITLRKPIHVQYSEAFSPYLGTLPPDAIARSFKLGVHFLPRFLM
jgi:hypothetical protein